MTDCIAGKCVYNKAKEFAARFNSFDKVFNKLIEFADDIPKRKPKPGNTDYARYLVDKKQDPVTTEKRLGRGEYKGVEPASPPKPNKRKEKKSKRKQLIADAQKKKNKPKKGIGSFGERKRAPIEIPKKPSKGKLTNYAKQLVENNPKTGPKLRAAASKRLQDADEKKVKERAGQQRTTRTFGGDEVRIVEKADPNPGPEKMQAARNEIKAESGKSMKGKTVKQTKKTVKRVRRNLASDPETPKNISNESVDDSIKRTGNKRNPRVTGGQTQNVPRVTTKKSRARKGDRTLSPQHTRNTPTAKVNVPEINPNTPVKDLDNRALKGYANRWRQSKHTKETTSKGSKNALRGFLKTIKTVGELRRRLRI